MKKEKLAQKIRLPSKINIHEERREADKILENEQREQHPQPGRRESRAPHEEDHNPQRRK